MSSSSDLTDFKRYLVGACASCNSSSGATGATGPAGPQGPALFTLATQSGLGVTLTSNTITATGASPFIVNTVEPYYTAFITFKLVSGSPTVGFVTQTFINTFSFAFQFANDGTYSVAYNGGGSVGSYSYNYGDIFTIALTSSTCKFFQNGGLILSIGTDITRLNVIGRAYGETSTSITNISYGYLNDPIAG